MKRNAEGRPTNGGVRVTLFGETDEIDIPDWVVDLESFRRWADADDFPRRGRVFWLSGRVWIDMSKEQLFTHGQVKTRMASTLSSLITALQLGYYWADGPLVSNEDGDLVAETRGTLIRPEERTDDREDE